MIQVIETSIQDNIKRKKELEKIIDNHPMSCDLIYEDNYILVKFLDDFMGIGGVRVSTLSQGSLTALTQLIKKLDELYNDENKHYSWHTELNSLV